MMTQHHLGLWKRNPQIALTVIFPYISGNVTEQNQFHQLNILPVHWEESLTLHVWRLFGKLGSKN